jgi:predicted lipid-binding transport protein (Tim44 family)
MNERDRLSTDDIARRERQASEAEQQRNAQRQSEQQAEQYVATGGAGAARTRDPNAQPRPAAQQEEHHTALFPERDITDLRARWDTIQTGFVDEPRRAVQQADELVAQAMKRLAEVFADERRKLESHWDRGDSASTEDLRVALQRYRSFFGRLLSI